MRSLELSYHKTNLHTMKICIDEIYFVILNSCAMEFKAWAPREDPVRNRGQGDEIRRNALMERLSRSLSPLQRIRTSVII